MQTYADAMALRLDGLRAKKAASFDLDDNHNFLLLDECILTWKRTHRPLRPITEQHGDELLQYVSDAYQRADIKAPEACESAPVLVRHARNVTESGREREDRIGARIHL